MVMRQLMSVEEYLALPEEKPYLEYVNGEVYEKPMPDWVHMQIAALLIRRLNAYVDGHGGFAGWEGRTGFADSTEQRYYLPDVQYYRGGLPRRRPLPPPTLSVEIRSEGQSMQWLREKCRYFREHGTEAAWLIDPFARSVEVFEGERDGETLRGETVLTSEALPGFELPLAELFAVLDQD